MRAIMTAVFSLALCSAASFAQVSADPRVPLRDGVYTDSREACAAFKKSELDLVPYEIEHGGRTLNSYEAACVVASIKTIRPHRYLVETDCREFDEVSQQTFILDAPSREKFRIEGEDTWCAGPPEAAPQKPSTPSAPPAPALRKLSNKALIDYWADQNEGCRGGFPDDPATERSCRRRTGASDELNRRGLCFKPVRGQMDWARCR